MTLPGHFENIFDDRRIVFDKSEAESLIPDINKDMTARDEFRSNN